MNSYRTFTQLLLFVLMTTAVTHSADAAPKHHPRAGRMLHRTSPTGSVNIRDCFLPRRSDTPDELIQQVETNPNLRARYARFFRIPDASVAGFLRTNLRPGHIPKADKYTVFYIHPTGTIYPTLVDLPEAMRIYVRPNGQPFLDAMGNPIRPYRLAEEIIVITPPDSDPNATVPEKIVPTLDVPIVVPTPTPAPIPVKPVTPEPAPSVVTEK